MRDSCCGAATVQQSTRHATRIKLTHVQDLKRIETRNRVLQNHDLVVRCVQTDEVRLLVPRRRLGSCILERTRDGEVDGGYARGRRSLGRGVVGGVDGDESGVGGGRDRDKSS